jgi:hypothetical protein
VNYLDAIAQSIRNQIPPELLPDGDTADLFRAYAVLALTCGAEATREDVHNSWVAWMLSRGQNHESMVPFSELDAATQNEDSPFVAAIRTAAGGGQRRGSQAE